MEGWAGAESWTFGPIGGGSSTSLTAGAPDAPSGSLTEYCSSGEVDRLRPRRRPSTIVSSIGQDSRCSSSPAPKIRSSLSTKMFHVEPSTEAPSPSSGQRSVDFVGLNIGPDVQRMPTCPRWHPDRIRSERVPRRAPGGRCPALRRVRRSGEAGRTPFRHLVARKDPGGIGPGLPLLLSANRRHLGPTDLVRESPAGWVPDTYFAGPCGPPWSEPHTAESSATARAAAETTISDIQGFGGFT